MRWSYCFEGTFITQDGALFVVPAAARRRMPKLPAPGRNLENWMLGALFETNLDPLLRLARTPRNPSTPVAMGRPMRAQTAPPSQPPPPSEDLRSEYSRLSGIVGSRPLREGFKMTRRSPEQGATRFRFDCLLLMGEGVFMEPGRKVRQHSLLYT